MTVGLDPESMTAEERLDEVAVTLAVGLLRLRCWQVPERRFLTWNCLEVPAETRLSVTVKGCEGENAWN